MRRGYLTRRLTSMNARDGVMAGVRFRPLISSMAYRSFLEANPERGELRALSIEGLSRRHLWAIGQYNKEERCYNNRIEE